jgi:hypothetical protein
MQNYNFKSNKVMRLEKEIIRVKEMSELTNLMLKGVIFDGIIASDLYKISDEEVEIGYDFVTTNSVTVKLKHFEEDKSYLLPKEALEKVHIEPELVKMKPLDVIIEELNGNNEVTLSIADVKKHLWQIPLGVYEETRLTKADDWLYWEEVHLSDKTGISVDGFAIPNECLIVKY